MAGLNFHQKAAAHMKKSLNLNKEEEEIIAYSVELILHNILTFSLIILIAWLFGCLPTALTATAVTSIYRALSGGAHSKFPINCTIMSVLIATLIGKLSVLFGNQIPVLILAFVITLISAISLISIWILVPVDSPAKPITSDIHRKRLRQLSFMTILCISTLQLFLINSNHIFFAQYVLAMSLGIAWQTFTLTRWGHDFVFYTDIVINKIVRR